MCDSPCSCRLCCGLRYALRRSLFIVACCLSNGRLRQQWACISVGTVCLGNGWLRQQWACISVGTGCLGNGWLRQQWACISVGAGCLGNGWLCQQWACISVGAGCLSSGGRPSPKEHLGPSARDSLKLRFCSSHWVSQTICPYNPLGWPTVQVSFSLKFSPLKSQISGSTGHPDQCSLCGALCSATALQRQPPATPATSCTSQNLCLASQVSFIPGNFPVLWATKIRLEMQLRLTVCGFNASSNPGLFSQHHLESIFHDCF